jgi:hypothetical protein
MQTTTRVDHKDLALASPSKHETDCSHISDQNNSTQLTPSENKLFVASLGLDLGELFSKCLNADYYINNLANDIFYDVVFIVGERKIVAHKAIVGARSPFFKGLFMDRMKGIQENVFEIEECSYEIFACVLHWTYTDDFKIPENDSVEKIEKSKIWDLWKAATFFCMDALVLKIEENLMERISNDNVCSFWNDISVINTSNLTNFCKNYFTKNIKEIVENKSFGCLKRDIVADIFKDLDKDPYVYIAWK